MPRSRLPGGPDSSHARLPFAATGPAGPASFRRADRRAAGSRPAPVRSGAAGGGRGDHDRGSSRRAGRRPGGRTGARVGRPPPDLTLTGASRGGPRGRRHGSTPPGRLEPRRPDRTEIVRRVDTPGPVDERPSPGAGRHGGAPHRRSRPCRGRRRRSPSASRVRHTDCQSVVVGVASVAGGAGARTSVDGSRCSER
jgi:hypothetical protein